MSSNSYAGVTSSFDRLRNSTISSPTASSPSASKVSISESSSTESPLLLPRIESLESLQGNARSGVLVGAGIESTKPNALVKEVN